jgi:hypothetical protein
LLVEFVIVSISPVPKLEPGPVSYIHCESIPLPDDPPKSSLNTVDQPEGGPGTAAAAGEAPTAALSAIAMAGAAIHAVARRSRGVWVVWVVRLRNIVVPAFREGAGRR